MQVSSIRSGQTEEESDDSAAALRLTETIRGSFETVKRPEAAGVEGKEPGGDV